MKLLDSDNGRSRYAYDDATFNLVDLVAEMFKTTRENLSRLHELEGVDYDLFTKLGTEVHTHYHKIFYGHVNPQNASPSTIGGEFLDVYRQLALHIEEHYFREDVYVQRIPSFRIQLPGNRAIAQPHRDIDGGSREEEVNVFLPLANAFDSNTIWAESSYGAQDHSPLTATQGEFIVWNGALLEHYNKVNTTGQSRISIDFRFLPVKDYSEREELTSLNLDVPMSVGHYFMDLANDK